MDLLAAVKAGFIIGDGGYGATIISHGLASGECEESWNLAHPERIEGFHREFIQAGSELLQANTFGANRVSLARHSLADKVGEMNRAGVEIARRAAAGKDIFVVGSMGPCGELLQPYGDLTEDSALHAFSEQAAALAKAGADGLFVETFTSIEEAEIAVRAAKQTGLPVAASMSFQASGATVMGVKPEQAVERLSAAGADIIGANCGIGPAQLFPIMQEIKSCFSGPTLAQPNAGMPQLVEGKTVFPETPETMADFAVRFRDLGINIIGGCCGTRPEHIWAMAEQLRGK
ncbi:MAG: methionine synthase [Armatimonadetes bacterium]|nr:methionine synthase [Armatimonadota bacterium]NIM22946.1 methionine synthase [Armatimonadota bacterium]NIM66817.1 methionine synthase [Armatimonadota bacterium]NIM75358.1 methionine synthase [Armatimonadota bacterium]NIN05005.1 methionine synthase [Armatimonadota bacterium]